MTCYLLAFWGPFYIPQGIAGSSPQTRSRIAGLLIQATKIAGGSEAFAMEVLPQIIPIFTTPPAQRALYGSSAPALAPVSPRAAAQTHRPDVGARMAQALALTVGHGQIRQPATLGAAEDSGFWDLVYLLYPEAAEAVGLNLLRELVHNWAVTERELADKFGWQAGGFKTPAQLDAGDRRLLRTLRERTSRLCRSPEAIGQTWCPEEEERGLQRLEHTSAVIEGAGWSIPTSQTPTSTSGLLSSSLQGPGEPSWASRASPFSPSSSVTPSSQLGASPSVATDLRGSNSWGPGGSAPPEGPFFPGSLPGGTAPPPPPQASAGPSGAAWLGDNSDSSSTNQKGWRWYSPTPEDNADQWADAARWRVPLPRTSDGRWWGRAWRLRATVVHSWQAHREGARDLVAGAGEELVASAGRAQVLGRDAEVVRCWRLSDASAGVQYVGHHGPVTSMCILAGPASPLASCDATGSIHVWSTSTGIQVARFQEAAASGMRRSPSSALFSKSPSRDNLRDQAPVGWALPARGQGSPSGTGLAAAADVSLMGGTGAFGGYTYVVAGNRDASDCLLAGMYNGRVRWLDLEVKVRRADIYCRPLGRWPHPGAVGAVQQGPGGGGSVIVAGLASGHVGVADARSGQLIASWKGHDSLITALHCHTEYSILTASQDNAIKLWDLRMDAAHVGAGQVGAPGLLHTFTGHTEGVGGLAVHGQDVLAYSGAYLGVFSLQGPLSPTYRPTRLTSAKGFKESADIVGLALLPSSRLLVVGTEDGYIKVCH
eukprot:jgi/Botrbrau1/121/Bobra.0022s0107.1